MCDHLAKRRSVLILNGSINRARSMKSQTGIFPKKKRSGCADVQMSCATSVTELWTLKEAYLKAEGVGFSGSLSGVSFRFDDQTGIEFSAIISQSIPSGGILPCSTLTMKCDWQLESGSIARPGFLMREDGGDKRPCAPSWMSGRSPKVSHWVRPGSGTTQRTKVELKSRS